MYRYVVTPAPPPPPLLTAPSQMADIKNARAYLSLNELQAQTRSRSAHSLTSTAKEHGKTIISLLPYPKPPHTHVVSTSQSKLYIYCVYYRHMCAHFRGAPACVPCCTNATYHINKYNTIRMCAGLLGVQRWMCSGAPFIFQWGGGLARLYSKALVASSTTFPRSSQSTAYYSLCSTTFPQIVHIYFVGVAGTSRARLPTLPPVASSVDASSFLAHSMFACVLYVYTLATRSIPLAPKTRQGARRKYTVSDCVCPFAGAPPLATISTDDGVAALVRNCGAAQRFALEAHDYFIFYVWNGAGAGELFYKRKYQRERVFLFALTPISCVLRSRPHEVASSRPGSRP